MSFIQAALIYGFPLYIVLIELLVRAFLAIDTQAFVGPSLAAVGLGFLVPLLHLKDRASEYGEAVDKEAQEKEAILVTKKDLDFLMVVIAILLLLLVLWVVSLVLSVQDPIPRLGIIPIPYLSGVPSYIIGIVLSVVKESI